MGKLHQKLTAARQLITPRSAWCQGTFARDSRGVPIDPADPRASSFCVYGAIAHVDGYSISASRLCVDNPYIGFAARYITAGDNDELNHDQVLRLFDRAVERAKGESW